MLLTSYCIVNLEANIAGVFYKDNLVYKSISLREEIKKLSVILKGSVQSLFFVQTMTSLCSWNWTLGRKIDSPKMFFWESREKEPERSDADVCNNL